MISPTPRPAAPFLVHRIASNRPLLGLRTRLGSLAGDRGYVAVMTAILMFVLLGFCAFAVDTGRWYLTSQQAQRAADAAALAGVTNLPGDDVAAFAVARKYSTINGFSATDPAVIVTPAVDNKPTRLRVTVSRRMTNLFGALLGVPTTTVTRTAVADYAGPVPMGSPCNEFGDDPDNRGERSANCDESGQFWANVGSPKAKKASGDAYQNEADNNTDYDANGYFYQVVLTKPVTNLRIQAFDAGFVDVGDTCTDGSLDGAANVLVAPVADASTRYAKGPGPYCTGDVLMGGDAPTTQFAVRSPSPSVWDPLTYPLLPGCTQTFPGYDGKVKEAIDMSPANVLKGKYDPLVAASFRRWTTLCTVPFADAGVYLVQVRTNGLGNDKAAGHNRFSLRATSSDNDSMAFSGFNKMAVYANTPSGTSRFFLARINSGARGQMLTVRLFDIGDGAKAGSTIKVLPPKESSATFTNCSGSGVTNGSLPTCSIPVSSSYNGKWQNIQVPIPANYTCQDTTQAGCWIRLEFFYGSGSTPADTTSWTVALDGDPVRLVE